MAVWGNKKSRTGGAGELLLLFTLLYLGQLCISLLTIMVYSTKLKPLGTANKQSDPIVPNMNHEHRSIRIHVVVYRPRAQLNYRLE